MKELKRINKFYIGEHLYKIENGNVITYEIIVIERNLWVKNEIVYTISNISNKEDLHHATEIILEKNYSRDQDTLKQKYYERKIKKLEEEKEKIENEIEEIKGKFGY